MTHTPKNTVERMASASGWLIFDRSLRMGLGFVVSILVARHYGPTQWGILSYVLASATLFGSIATAGSEDLILRDLSKTNSEQDIADIQKTVFILRLIFGGIAYAAFLILVAATQGFGLPLYVALAYGIIFVFQASEIWEYRLRIEHRIFVMAKTHILSSLLSNGLKILTLLLGWPLICIATAMSSESATNLGLLARYRARHWARWAGQFNQVYAKKLLKASLLVMLSGFLIAGQTRCEYYLIDHFMDLEAVGVYAVAFKSMELFDVLVVVFTMTLVPELAKRHTIELPILASRTYLLGFIFFLVMLVPIALIYGLFPWLYGEKYLAAQALIPWLALRPLFIILGSIRTIFLVMEGRLRYVPICAFVGLCFSISLGWFLIPAWGLTGAVISGLISLLISNLVMDLFFQRQNINRMLAAYRQWPYALHRGLQLLKMRQSDA